MSCPCGSGRAFADCCAPLLRGERAPETAEQLMRSRYTAVTRAEVDYLLATHDPETRDVDAEAVERWVRRSRWLGLTVTARERGGPDDEHGVVEFCARYFDGRAVREHRERSVFRRLPGDGRWVYRDGAAPPGEHAPARARKVARNAPCPCGSGKKYKRCCGRAA